MNKEIDIIIISTTFSIILSSLIFTSSIGNAFAQYFPPIANPSTTATTTSSQFPPPTSTDFDNGCMNNGGHFPPGLIGRETCPSQTMALLPVEPLETLCMNPLGKHIPPGLVGKESCPPSMMPFPPANFPTEIPMDQAQFTEFLQTQSQSQSLNTQSLPFQFPMDNFLCPITSTFEDGLANGQHQEHQEQQQQPCFVNQFFLLPQQSPTTTTSAPVPSPFAAFPTAVQNPLQQHDYDNMAPNQFVKQIAPFNLQLPTN